MSCHGCAGTGLDVPLGVRPESFMLPIRVRGSGDSAPPFHWFAIEIATEDRHTIRRACDFRGSFYRVVLCLESRMGARGWAYSTDEDEHYATWLQGEFGPENWCEGCYGHGHARRPRAVAA